MNKSKFLNLLQHPGQIQDKSLQVLEQLAEDFPYCQATHVMIAKGYHSLSKEGFEKKLNRAAVYTADRKHLKDIIEGKVPEDATTPFEDHKAKGETVSSTGHEAFSEDFLKKEIELYLEKLRAEKTSLELQGEEGLSEELVREKAMFKNELAIKIAEAEAKLARIQNANSTKETQEDEADGDEEKLLKDKDNEAFYNELEENLQALQAHKEKVSRFEKDEEKFLEENTDHKPDAFSPLSNNIEKERMEEYLASLKASEQKSIENHKVREQIRLINDFIEKEPTLSRPERRNAEEEEKETRIDLSLKSLKAGENIASENLALIMAKQGKLEKAEEIYNKLIWKFPEKKAYFVARIEELKKK